MTEHIQFIGGPIHGQYIVVDDFCLSWRSGMVSYTRRKFIIPGHSVRDYFICDKMPAIQSSHSVAQAFEDELRNKPDILSTVLDAKARARRWVATLETVSNQVCAQCGERRSRHLIAGLCFRCHGKKASTHP